MPDKQLTPMFVETMHTAAYNCLHKGLVMSPDMASNVTQSYMGGYYEADQARSGYAEGDGPCAGGRMVAVQAVASADDIERAVADGDKAVQPGEQVEPPEHRPVNVRMGYGKLDSKQGVHLKPPAKRDYQCADCKDLEERITKAFKEQGFNF